MRTYASVYHKLAGGIKKQIRTTDAETPAAKIHDLARIRAGFS